MKALVVLLIVWKARINCGKDGKRIELGLQGAVSVGRSTRLWWLNDSDATDGDGDGA